jgi:hypothetical protein
VLWNVPGSFAQAAKRSTNRALTLTDAAGRCTAAVTVSRDAPALPDLIVLEPTDEAWVTKALRPARDPANSVFRELAKELQAFGAAVPAVKRPPAEGPALLAQAGIAVIARRPALARRVLGELLQGPPGKAAKATRRVAATRLEPGTVFSWLDLPVGAVGTPAQGHEPVVLAEPVGGPIFQGRAPPPGVPAEALVGVGREGVERFVVLRGAAGATPDPGDPWRLRAQVRTISWAVQYVTTDGGPDRPLVSDSRPEVRREVAGGPLLTELDVQQAIAQEVVGMDLAVVALVGLYLAVLTGGILRQTPAP